MKSPIKYFGGKGGMFAHIIECFPEISSKEIYIEAFGGGASILFQKEASPVEIYNDLEKNVYSFFKVISDKKMFKEFKELCDLSYYSAALREEYREDLKDETIDIVNRAYKYFYVNRSSVNGVGGFACTVNYVRRHMSKSISDFLSAIDGLRDAHERLSSVIIENRDAIKLIQKYDREYVFFYLDPPYHHLTRTMARYKEDMDNAKQEEFIELLLSLKYAKVLLSGYRCKPYDILTDNGWERRDFVINTQDGKRKPKTKTESLWLNYKPGNRSTSNTKYLSMMKDF